MGRCRRETRHSVPVVELALSNTASTARARTLCCGFGCAPYARLGKRGVPLDDHSFRSATVLARSGRPRYRKEEGLIVSDAAGSKARIELAARWPSSLGRALRAGPRPTANETSPLQGLSGVTAHPTDRHLSEARRSGGWAPSSGTGPERSLIWSSTHV
jgi:hypothetical protein